MKCEYVPFIDLLSNIVDNRGRTCPTQENGVPLIATNCITNDTLYPTYEKIRYVSIETYSTWFRGHPKPGDLIFVTKGSPGHVCVVPDPIDFCIAQDMVAIRADKTKIYPKYLFAILRTKEIQQKIENLHVGTLIPHFKKGDFDKLFLPVVDNKYQKIIGDIYFDLSAKIELNRRMNRTLESIAQALFKEWFVDNPEVEGWERKQIGEVVIIVGGTTPSTKNLSYWDNGSIHWATPKDLSSLDSPFLLDTERKITQEGLQQISSGLLPKGVVLLSSRAPIGYLAISQMPVAINQGFIALVCSETVPNYYILNWLIVNMDMIKGRANGTTFQEISKSNFRPMPIVLPPQILLNNFIDLVSPLYEKIINNLQESNTLIELRDTLLPRLMRGEVRVKDVA